MTLKICIIDYNAGNLRNVQKAFERLGYFPIVTNKEKEVENSDVIILPGVGSFNDGMDHIEDLGLHEVIRQQVLMKKKPILGICLGMQLLAWKGMEGGPRTGLEILPIIVIKLKSAEFGLTLPHIGWNDLEIISKSVLFREIPDKPDFYFAHSYHGQCENKEIISSYTEYGEKFVSTIEYENIFATQFHPEKSQRYGLKILKNFINYCENNRS